MRRGFGWVILVVSITACGAGKPPASPSRWTETFAASLDDPERCTCGDGLGRFTINVVQAGTLDAAATVRPAEAQLVVRLLDPSYTTVLATSVLSGSVARLSHPVTAGTYPMEVFLASDGPRQATFTLTVTHP